MKCISQHCYEKIMDAKMVYSANTFFSELYKIMVNKVTFLGFRRAIARPNTPLDPPLK